MKLPVVMYSEDDIDSSMYRPEFRMPEFVSLLQSTFPHVSRGSDDVEDGRSVSKFQIYPYEGKQVRVSLVHIAPSDAQHPVAIFGRGKDEDVGYVRNRLKVHDGRVAVDETTWRVSTDALRRIVDNGDALKRRRSA